MVTFKENILQVINSKQSTQSKVKEGNVSNDDFLMALFAAEDVQQGGVTDVVNWLLGEHQEQQQSNLNHNELESSLPNPQVQLPIELQELLIKMQAQLKHSQSVVETPKKMELSLLGQLENLLSNPQFQLTSDQKVALKELQVQLQAKQPTALLSTQIETKLLSKLEELLSTSELQSKAIEATKEVVQTPSTKLNEQLIKASIKQQQTGEVDVKAKNIITELPKATLMVQNKATIEVQPTEQNTGKQETTVISQFAKPATERPVEQVLQQSVKINEVSAHRTTQQLVSNQSTEPQSFATVVNNKAAGMDAKVDFVQPEQMASKLLGMVKDMATKQQPNQTTMHLKLNPEHLGEVIVRLTYNRGELNAQFYAATAQGKEALEAALPQMRDALLQQQVKLNEAAVYLNNDDGNQWLGGRQGNQGGNRGKNHGYYNNNSLQPKVSEVLANNYRIVEDSLNILV